MISNRVSFLFIIIFLFTVIKDNNAQQIAFPGAEGYGKYSIGGRGGKVVFVTNLDDSGPGSFRAACEATFPRIVIFKVGGLINLKSTINIKSPYITIAGQTAPGDGICIRHAGVVGFGNPLMSISTNNVIVRFLRLRRGPSMEGECCGDCMTIAGSSAVFNIIIDHCSMSWSTDEILNIWNTSYNITVQNCIFSEALSTSSHMENGVIEKHSMGPFFGDNADKITIYRNLFAHTMDRNPWMQNRRSGKTGTFQFVNNVVYNWTNFGTKVGTTTGYTKADIISNYFKSGPDTKIERYELLLEGSVNNIKVYVKDNIGHHRLTADNPNSEWYIVGVNMTQPASNAFRSEDPLSSFPLPILAVNKSYDSVINFAGSNARINSFGEWEFNRDSVDIRVLNDAKTGGPFVSRLLKDGKRWFGLIDDPVNVGGWPDYFGGEPFIDNDGDGMSDVWELSVGLDSDNPDDANLDRNSDGYTNIEEFINGKVKYSETIISEHMRKDVNVEVHPNPCVNTINLRWRSNFSPKRYSIYNNIGKLIYSDIITDGVCQNINLDLGFLSKGFYFVLLQSDFFLCEVPIIKI